ncbi:MAG: 30S ribosome-binding factor RbfA [Bryobacteraceae bacterium]
MDPWKAQRVSEAIREELAEIVSFELSDPRLAIVDINSVTLLPNRRDASVCVGLHGDETEQHHALEALEHARHYLRHELARRLRLRRVPELHFAADGGDGVPARVEALLKRAKKKSAR